MSIRINLDNMTINGKPLEGEMLKNALILEDKFEEIYKDEEDEEDGV